VNINPHIPSGAFSGTCSEIQKLQQEQLSSTQETFSLTTRSEPRRSSVDSQEDK
jgi:hypothetical protein